MIASETDIKIWLSIAKKAAFLAGESLLERKQVSKKIDIESGRDIKIAADIESEGIILNYLKENSSFLILSEESGLIPSSEQKFTWIIDPLDGSLNYLRGIPFSCVSIGLWQTETPLLGVVYDFNRLALFSGIVGKGGWLNDNPIKVSTCNQKNKAVLCTGFPVNTDFSPEGIRFFIDNVRAYKKIRLLGSAALSVVYVASGMADVYYERDIMFWDVAGGIPILLGSGGKLNMEGGCKKYSYNVFVSNGYFNL